MVILSGDKMNKKLAILGAGNLGTAIASGLVKTGFMNAENIILCRRKTGKLDSLKKLGMTITDNQISAVENSDIIILSVQPGQLCTLLEEIKPYLDRTRHNIISTITGVSVKMIEKELESTGISVIRAMPNTAISIGASMTCICTDQAEEKNLKECVEIFDALGETIILEEKLMKAATVLAASNIAFFMRMLRATTQGGIQLGFSSEDAQAIAVQVAKGAAMLLQKHESHPEMEIDKVTTPQGCTIEGLNEMEHQGLSSAIIKGLVASYEKITNISCLNK